MKAVRDLTTALLAVLALGCQSDAEWTQPRAVDEMRSESVSGKPERMVSLRCLYLLTWQCMGYEQKRVRLEPLLERVSSGTSVPDVVRWVARSKGVVERDRSSDIGNGDRVHDDWALGGLADR